MDRVAQPWGQYGCSSPSTKIALCGKPFDDELRRQ